MSGAMLETWVAIELLKGYWHNGLAAPSRDDLRHFEALGRLKRPVGAGGVICLAQDVLPLTAAAHTIPVGVL